MHTEIIEFQHFLCDNDILLGWKKENRNRNYSFTLLGDNGHKALPSNIWKFCAKWAWKYLTIGKIWNNGKKYLKGWCPLERNSTPYTFWQAKNDESVTNWNETPTYKDSWCIIRVYIKQCSMSTKIMVFIAVKVRTIPCLSSSFNLWYMTLIQMFLSFTENFQC